MLASAGIAFGLAGALVGTRAMLSLLYKVDPVDPATFVAVSLMLCAAALAASWIPARRASRVDPMETLRGD
jgi:putative ABC transport system permease protein